MTLIIWRNRKANFLKHPIVFTIHLHKELRYTVILITLQDRWNFTRYYLPYFSPLSLFCLAFTSVAMELSNVCHYTTSWEDWSQHYKQSRTARKTIRCKYVNTKTTLETLTSATNSRYALRSNECIPMFQEMTVVYERG